ncbi:putative nucleotide-binding protein containing TIR-like domain protein [Anatilimnocola aggregata]|uniref:Putative nucleotide-binding protein containing TIR-like domain protein n=1 Tax=Anatilimnocola aggregata TaxID=2528021 RepID=A0A517YML2_9BACT|nr:nucleotide-binding protein [Anatilimnocola aggregata]QDU31462.1 putative nucleotide-binding protein containing TIR-like domain protein [Anatilimnocola aggregata]
MTTIPYVFIGSSVEGLDAAKAIQSNLQYCCESHIWHQGLFGLSGGTLETLVNNLDSFDFAVLCLTPDDLTISRGQEKKAPRDNVILELGLFMGKLGRERVYLVIDRDADAKMPSDLAGITPAKFTKPQKGNWLTALGPACTDIEREVKRLGCKSGHSDLNFIISPFVIGGNKVSIMMVIENRSSNALPPHRIRLKRGTKNHFPFKPSKENEPMLPTQFRAYELPLIDEESRTSFTPDIKAMVTNEDGTNLSESEMSEFCFDILLKDSYTVLYRSEELGYGLIKLIRHFSHFETGMEIIPSDVRAIFDKHRLALIDMHA